MLSVADIVAPLRTSGLLESDGLSADTERILGMIPARTPPMIGFESRLKADDKAIDVFLGFNSTNPSELLVSAHVLGKEAPSASPVYDGLGTFARRWQDSPELRRAVEHIWLEYDASAQVGGHLTLPGVFLGRGTARSGETGRVDWIRSRILDVGQMSHYAVPDTISERACEYVARLPSGATPTSVGFFLGRTHEAIRVCLGGLTIDSTYDYLKKIAYRGKIVGLRDSIRGLSSEARGTLAEIGLIHIDIGRDLGKRVGIEFVFEFKRQLVLSRIDEGILNSLVRLGLADRVKCTALATWPGAFWGGEHPRRLLIRRVNHIKIVFDGERVTEAKAYFGIRVGLPRYLRRQGSVCAIEQAER